MDPIAELKTKLAGHSKLEFDEVLGGIRIHPPVPNGFAVEVHDDSDSWTVFLGNAGFHETFDTAEETLEFVAWCYSGEARVREVWRGDSPAKSVLEVFEDGKWRSTSETTLIFVPFWRRRRETILANPNLLKP